MIEAAVGVGS